MFREKWAPLQTNTHLYRLGFTEWEDVVEIIAVEYFLKLGFVSHHDRFQSFGDRLMHFARKGVAETFQNSTLDVGGFVASRSVQLYNVRSEYWESSTSHDFDNFSQKPPLKRRH